jgi:hypothetical protein
VLHALSCSKRGGSDLQFVSDRLKGDPKVVCAAVAADSLADVMCTRRPVLRRGFRTRFRTSPGRLEYNFCQPDANDSYKNSFVHASAALKADKAHVLAALRVATSYEVGRRRHPLFLDCVPDSLRADKRVVLAAMRLNCMELRTTDFPDPPRPEFRDDKGVAVAAITQYGRGGFMHIDPSFVDDHDLWKLVVTLHPMESKELFPLTLQLKRNALGRRRLRASDWWDCQWNLVGELHKVPRNILTGASNAIRANKELATIAVRRADSSLQHIIWKPTPRFWSPPVHSLMFREQRRAVRVFLTIGIRLHSDDEWGMPPPEIYLHILSFIVHPLGDASRSLTNYATHCQTLHTC